VAYDDTEFEEGSYSDEPPERLSLAEIRAIAELAAFLEHDIGADLTRVRIRLREGVATVQGGVDSHQEKQEIEEALLRWPTVRSVENNLAVTG